MTWPVVPLGEIATVVSGATPKTEVPSYWGGSVRWATPKDLSALASQFIADTPRKLTDAGLRSCAATVLPPGSVLLSSRAPIGHVAINTVPMATNQGFKSLVPGDRLHAFYLLHWLRAHRALLESLGNGATFKELSKATVSALEIPLPSMAEQRRIADVLDRADKIRAKRLQSIRRFDMLNLAVYAEMFGRDEANLHATPSTSLSELASVSSGITMGRRTTESTVRVPYVTVANVQDRRLDLRNVKTIDATAAEVERYRLAPGDLLLTEGGDPDKLGRGTLWRSEIETCIHQNHIFRVRVTRTDLVDPLYLNWHVGSRRGKSYFLRSAKQTTGIASINSTQLRAFPVLLPPLKEQQQFADRIAEINSLTERAQAHLRQLDQAITALRHRAFRGEL